VCDGFGHAYCYVAAGTYTVVAVTSGVVQQVYPDQVFATSGAASSGVTSLNSLTGDLSVTADVGSGVEVAISGSSIQLSADVTTVFGRIGDVVASAGDYSNVTGLILGDSTNNCMLVFDDPILGGAGCLRIAGGGGSYITFGGTTPLVAIYGGPIANQGVIEIDSDGNMGFTAGEGGIPSYVYFWCGKYTAIANDGGVWFDLENAIQVLLPSDTEAHTQASTDNSTQVATTAFVHSVAGGASFSTAGQGFFLGGQSFGPVVQDSSTMATNNVVYVVQLNLLAPYKISKVVEYTQTASGSGEHFTAGLYSADGNTKLIDAGANAFQLSDHSQYSTVVTLGASVTVGPGTYWFAFGGASVSSGANVLSHVLGQGMTALLDGAQFGTGPTLSAKFGTAANALSAGALPATLGAITALDNSNLQYVPAIAFMV